MMAVLVVASVACGYTLAVNFALRWLARPLFSKLRVERIDIDTGEIFY